MSPSHRWSLTDAIHERYRHFTGVPVVHDVRPYYAPLRRMDEIGCGPLSDRELQSSMRELRLRARDGEPLAALLPEVFAAAREGAARVLGMRPFDVQVAAGVALHHGCLAQLATGEGKTLVAVLPALLRALAGRGVHIFTANDYLARRDAEWMGPLYRFFDVDAAFVVQGMTGDERRRAYVADVTYVTAKEAGFDYLRDHTALDDAHVVHRGHDFAIVDEADFILIDEARVPLVIAREAAALEIDHTAIASVVRRLQSGIDYTADDYGRTVVLTEGGFRHAGDLLGASLSDDHLLLSAVQVALHAEALLRRDRDYVVRDETVAVFDRLTVADGAIDLTAARLAGSSSTWTYLVDDNPFSTLGLSMIANRNVGAAAAGGLVAMMYLPVSAVAAAVVFVRRWLKRRR